MSKPEAERIEEVETAGKERFRFSPRPNRAGEIDWRGWGPEAFSEAREQGKLVLLSISAVWCHWCHVMDETTYSDPGVIERVNRDFMPVRVDSDRRPDINRRYNQGGWPTTAFLTPSGRAVAGLTYAPAERLGGILDRLSAVYRARRQGVEVEATAIAAEEMALMAKGWGGEPPGAKVAGEVFLAVLEGWDRRHGGLGGESKFPSPGALELAMHLMVETGDERARSFVTSTLDGMLEGELFDRVEGGFFRYATRADWSVPHYEKMLSDNAELARLYLAASVLLDRPDYEAAARDALDYTMANLLDEGRRGFMGSQDADEDYYGMDAGGRAAHLSPAIDDTIFVDSNARMLSTLASASAALDNPDLLSLARRSADFMWERGYRHGLGVCHYFTLPEGSPALWGQAADQVYFLAALTDIYQSTGLHQYLERAVESGGLLAGRYTNSMGWLGEPESESGPDAGDEGVLNEVPPEPPDIAVNGSGARALLVLDALAPGRGFREAAEGVMRSLSGAYGSYSHFASGYALAADLLDKGFIEVRIAPDLPEAERAGLAREAAALFRPRVIVRPEIVDDYPPVEGDGAAPRAVVCAPGSCSPVESTVDLAAAIASNSSPGAAGGVSE